MFIRDSCLRLQGMADLRDEDFRQFVCVESGTVRASATGWKHCVFFFDAVFLLDFFVIGQSWGGKGGGEGGYCFESIIRLCMLGVNSDPQLNLEQRGSAARSLKQAKASAVDSAIICSKSYGNAVLLSLRPNQI